MEYKIKTLSPVHIGCGEQLTGLNFILDGKKMYVLEPESIISLLGPEKGLKFAQWLEINSNEIAKLDAEHWEEKKKDPRSEKTKTAKRDLKNKKQSLNLRVFVDERKLVSLEQLKGKAVYLIAAQDGVYKDSEISPFVKQARMPYIPGTEIKGAIRTAILYCSLQTDKSLQSWLSEKLKGFQAQHAQSLALVANEKNLGKPNPNNQRQKLSKLKEFLEKEMSRISDQFEENVLTCKPDAKYDVMKFLQVGDSPLLRVEDLVVGKAEPFNMSNKFPIICEYLRPETLIPLTSFKLETNNSRTKKLDRMGFTESHKKLMSGLNVIMSCCHYFYANLLQEEILYFKKHGKTSIVEHLQQIAKLNSPESPVLRIGKDEGYNSLTVGLAVKKLMPELYENVLIHATKNKSYDSQHGGPFPKSRKIVHWNGTEMTAGWVQLMPKTSDDVQQTNHSSKFVKQEAPAKAIDPASLQALQAKFGGRSK